MKFTTFILSGFYSGFLPKAPGTWGSVLATSILIFFTFLFPQYILLIAFVFLFFAFFLSALGIFILQKFSPKDCVKKPDQKWIVLDEFAGIFIASFPAFFYENIFISFFFAFLLFRFFDILKPLGIKKIDNWHTPFSVFADDLLAGIYAAMILSIGGFIPI